MQRHLLAALSGSILLSSGLLAQQLPSTVLLSNQPGAPNSTLPGIGPFDAGTSSSAAFFRPFVSSFDTAWSIEADLETGVGGVPTGTNEIALVNGLPVFRDGDPMPDFPAQDADTIDSRIAVNDLGQAVVVVNDSGATGADDAIVLNNNGVLSVVAREDDMPALIAPAPLGSIDSVSITDTGAIGFSSDDFSVNEDFVLMTDAAGVLTTVIAQDGVTIPTGQAGGAMDSWQNFDFEDLWISADGLNHLLQGDTDAGTGVDDIVTFNGAVVLQEDSTVGANLSPISLIDYVSLDAGNNWLARGSRDDGTDWVVRNGIVVTESNSGDPIVPGSLETWDDTGFSDCFFGMSGNLAGQFVVAGLTDSANDDADAVVVLDDGLGNRRIIMREGDPVDMDGNGLFDDDRFISIFSDDDFALGLSRCLAVVSVADGSGAAQDNVVLEVPTTGPLARFTVAGGTTAPGAPFMVDFISDSSSSAGPVTHSWDLDGDGIEDSTLPNPSFNYTVPGVYTVTLTVDDGSVTSTASVVDLVEVLPITADFTATPVSAGAPLMVQFTDTTAGAPTSWSWDLDGDGMQDSTMQNPMFTYTVAGSYDVTLTATNAFGSDMETKTSFITVEAVDADFTADVSLGPAPLMVNFTDASLGTPSSWSWDLDGDGMQDSTMQNPSFNYTVPGQYTVTLTATNPVSGMDTETKVNFIVVVGATQNTESAEVLSYQFNEVRGGEAANTASTTIAPLAGTVQGGNDWQGDPGRPVFMGNEPGFGMMRSNPAADYGVDTGWSVNLTSSYSIMWWQRVVDETGGNAYAFGTPASTGSFRCWDNGDDWTFNGSSATGNFATVSDINDQSNAGVWNHLALVMDDAAGMATWYINGVVDNTQALTGPINEQEGELSVGALVPGGSANSYFNHFDMDDFRLYSRALTAGEITTVMAGESPTSSNFGVGCSTGAGATPTLTTVGAPQLGNPTFAITAGGFVPASPVTLYAGLGATVDPVGPILLPVDLGALLPGLFTGCFIEVPVSTPLGATADGSGDATLPVPLPVDPMLIGVHVYMQALGLNGGGIGISRGLDINFQN